MITEHLGNYEELTCLIYYCCVTVACSLQKIVPDMTYNVFGGTLNLAQSMYPTYV